MSCNTDRSSAPTSRRTAPAALRGYTLLELLLSMSVLCGLLAVALPSVARLMSTSRLSSATAELVGALNLAHSEALRRSQPVTLGAVDATNYAAGWAVFTDANADGAPQSAANAIDGWRVRVTAAFAGTPTIKRVTRSASAPFVYTEADTPTRGYVVFTGRGAIAAPSAVFYRICDPASPGANGRIVQINVVGQVTLDSSNASCS